MITSQYSILSGRLSSNAYMFLVSFLLKIRTNPNTSLPVTNAENGFPGEYIQRHVVVYRHLMQCTVSLVALARLSSPRQQLISSLTLGIGYKRAKNWIPTGI